MTQREDGLKFSGNCCFYLSTNAICSIFSGQSLPSTFQGKLFFFLNFKINFLALQKFMTFSDSSCNTMIPNFVPIWIPTKFNPLILPRIGSQHCWPKIWVLNCAVKFGTDILKRFVEFASFLNVFRVIHSSSSSLHWLLCKMQRRKF